jgi:hypothetical protein
VIGNDCEGSCKFNYHTTTTAQVQLRWEVIGLLILMAFMIITVYKLSFHINQWKELVCWKYVFCWGSLDGICISCEVPSIADTTLGISEQHLFFCHQTGMVNVSHWILRLHTFFARTVLFILVNLMIIDELKQLTKVVRCWAWAV